MNLKTLLKLAAVAGISKAIYETLDDKARGTGREQPKRGSADDFIRAMAKSFAERKGREAEERIDRYKQGKARFHKEVDEAEVEAFFDKVPSSDLVSWPDLVKASTPGSRDRTIDNQLRELMLDSDFKEVQRRLLAMIKQSGDYALKKSVVETTVNRIAIKGLGRAFEALDDIERSRDYQRRRAADNAAGRDRGTKPYRPITAIGVNISSHAFEGIREEPRPLQFEVSFYTDGRFAFSTADHETLVALCRAGEAPWQGSGGVDVSVHAAGIQHFVADMLSMGDGEPSGPELAARIFLAQWWLYVTIARELSRALVSHTAPRVVPVLLGTHDIRPYTTTILYTAKPFEV